ncbi:preprotein translocase subunit SecE [Rickettsia endosymbiont of Cardiosporidium cionae]|uniref:preprotein translocase subunit SecE n=1 Tax=Rickettsia endosymbiont of Cardiosporidium cionae TaxID=2777155 RepID=UPI0018956BB5|nr:preprotein translocase subunit SecE [Rickettsia endosymbiont of Cardiosporidium cionae]
MKHIRESSLYKFLFQLYQEFKKIHWINRKELFNLVLVVVIAVFCCSVVILFIDYLIHHAIQFIIHLK